MGETTYSKNGNVQAVPPGFPGGTSMRQLRGVKPTLSNTAPASGVVR